MGSRPCSSPRASTTSSNLGIHSVTRVAVDLADQDERVAHQDPGAAIIPTTALKPNGWLNRSSVGTTPISPKGAVRMTMDIAESRRTWSMTQVSGPCELADGHD